MRAALAARGVTRVVTSPARRCLRLARAIAPEPFVDDRLQELDFGAWEGLNWDLVPRDCLDAWASDPVGYAPPGGESGAELIARVRQACAALREVGDDCIVVTHGGPLRLMPALLRGEVPDLLAPTFPIGAMITVHATQATAVNPAHSTTTAQPPSTSPVNPPI